MVMVLLKYGISHMEQDLSKLAIRLFKIFKDMYVHNFLCGEKFINVTDPAMARYVSLPFLRRRAIFRTENGIIVTLIIEQFVITAQEQWLTAIWNFMNKMTH